MLPSLLVAAAITAPAAPMPKDTLPNPTGPAPRVVAVKADASGAVWITANVYEKRKFPQQYVAVENGKQVVKTQEIEQTVSNYVRKQLGDFGGKFATAGGMTLTTEEATRRVKEGATLLITSDGKPIDKSWLKAVADDTVVMSAEGWAQPFVHGYARSRRVPRRGWRCSDRRQGARSGCQSTERQQNGQIYYDDFGGAAAVA